MMKRVTYIGVFEPNTGGYSVYFPDLPGCTSSGNTFMHACQQASEALGLHLYGMVKDGDVIPEPSDHPDLDSETAPGFLVSPITVFPDIVRNEYDNKAVKANLTLPAWMKEAAEARGINFSKVLQAALMDVLDMTAPRVVEKKDPYRLR